jgi:hypothetical protein
MSHAHPFLKLFLVIFEIKSPVFFPPQDDHDPLTYASCIVGITGTQHTPVFFVEIGFHNLFCLGYQ